MIYGLPIYLSSFTDNWIFIGKKQYTTVGNFDLPVKDGKIENIEWNDEGDVKKFQEIFKVCSHVSISY